MKKLQIGDWVNNSVPECFEECSFEQKLHAMTAKIFYQLDNMPDATVSTIKTELCLSLGRIPRKLFKQLTPEQIIVIKRMWRFVGDIKVTKLPFEYFDYQKVRYYLPAERFSNTSAIEWAMGMILYAQFGNAKTNKPLFELVATLCRPARADADAHRKSVLWNGDLRESYNSFLSQERVKLFEDGLPWGVVLCVKDYFENMLEQFVKKYELLFEESDMKPLFQGGEGCIAMLEDVAESQVYGNLNAVYEINIDNIYLFFKHKKMKAERDEDEHEKRQRDLDSGWG